METQVQIPVSTKTPGQVFWEFIKGLLLILAATGAIAYLAVRGWQVQEELANHGTTTQATVTTINSAGDKGGLYIAYTFTAPDAAGKMWQYRGQSWTSKIQKQGDTVPILYSRRSPGLSVAAEGYQPAGSFQAWLGSYLAGNLPVVFFGVLFVGLGGWIIARAAPAWSTAQRLEREGCNTRGEIENRGVYRTRHNNRGTSTSYWVSYHFEAGGRVYTLQQTVGHGQYQKWPPSTPATVRYLPDNPAVARLVK